MKCDEHTQSGRRTNHQKPRALQSYSASPVFAFGWKSASRVRNSDQDWRDGFGQAGIPSASIHAFDMFMTIISKTALRPIDVRRSTCHCMSQDEARFLGMIAAVQAGCFPMFQNLLGEWIPVTAVRAATMPISMLAGALDARSLRLPPATRTDNP